LSADATVREDHFHFEGVDYFRGHAAAVQLGDVGRKWRSTGGQSHLAAPVRLPRETLPLARVSRVDLRGALLRGSDIAACIAVAEVGLLGASTVARLLADETLCLVKLEAEPHDLVAAANARAGVHDVLSRSGSAARLVHQVFVILESATAIDLSQAERWSLSGTCDDCTLTAVGAAGRRNVVVLKAGATFAYLLLRPIWRGERIAGATPDAWGRS
jgi:hypothetical protein